MRIDLAEALFQAALVGGSGGGSVTVQPLSVSSNGIYSAPSGFAYSPVDVAVPMPSGTITLSANGTFNVASFESALVNVSATTPDTASIVLARDIRSLSSYTNTDATVIGQYGFAYFNIGSSTSQGITTYGTITLPNVTKISGNAFLSVGAEEVIMPSLANITEASAFVSAKIRRVSYPLLDRIPSSTFAICTNLSEVYLPNVSYIGTQAFSMCNNNPFSVTFGSALTSIGNGVFSSCIYLSQAVFDYLEGVPMYTFSRCTRLEMASFARASYISSAAFSSCYNLLSLYLFSTAVVSLQNASVFYSTPISTRTDSTGGVHGSIYVRESLYSSYITANNWSVYADRIVSLTDAQISALG